MALLFSAVTLTGDDDQMELLVPGIPRESNDLRGWTAYENFIASIDHEQEIRVHVAACLYGEGQPFLASPEEIAYFTLRAKEDDSFLCDHCSHAGHSDFQFTWSPEMSYGKETIVGVEVKYGENTNPDRYRNAPDNCKCCRMCQLQTHTGCRTAPGTFKHSRAAPSSRTA